ncbi:MAG: hypothetical protein ACOYL6_03015 [Bacteriovoracaceae bacterium]
MKTRTSHYQASCKIFRQLVRSLNTWAVLCALGTIPLSLEAGSRDVASFVSQDEVIVVPRQNESWYEANMIDDDQGIMNAMRVDIRRWQEQQQYMDLWNLHNTGIFPETESSDLTKRVSRDMLRYADKRLSGEVKKADKKSNLYKVGQAQRGLSPTTSVNFMEGYAVKVQARALQGKTTFVFKNPYTNTYLDVTLGGRREFVTERWFYNLFRTAINFRIDQSMYFTTFDYLITPSITVTLVSQQSTDSSPFSGASDKRVQLNYFKTF